MSNAPYHNEENAHEAFILSSPSGGATLAHFSSFTQKEVIPLQEDIENRTLTLIINTSKLTARTLATAFIKFLRFSRNKYKEHRDVKPQGKQSIKKLIAQNQGVEKTELTDREEVKTFGRIAKQYGMDYAIKKGVSQDGQERYMLFFKARDRSAIDQAMATYSLDYLEKHPQERPPVEAVLDPLKELIPGRKKERLREKGLER